MQKDRAPRICAVTYLAKPQHCPPFYHASIAFSREGYEVFSICLLDVAPEWTEVITDRFTVRRIALRTREFFYTVLGTPVRIKLLAALQHVSSYFEYVCKAAWRAYRNRCDLYEAHDLPALLPALVVSMAMAPAVDRLQRHRLSRSVSVIVIYLVLLVLLIGFIVLLVPPIVEQLTATVPKIESYYRDLKAALMSSPLLVIRQIEEQMPAQINLMPTHAAPPTAGAPTTGGALDAMGQVLDVTGTILNGLVTLTGLLLIGFYWTLEGDHAVRALILPLPGDQRESAREVLKEVETRVGGYVRGQGFLALVVGAAALIVYLLIGLPAALAVALLAGLFELIQSAQHTLKLLKLPPGTPVVTRDQVKRAKPDPDLFLAAAEQLHVPIAKCIVVGDSVWDLLAARRASALGVGLLSGGYGREELERAGAYRTYDDPADLLRHLDECGVQPEPPV